MGNTHSSTSWQPRLFTELFARENNDINIPDMCGILKLGKAPSIQVFKVCRTIGHVFDYLVHEYFHACANL